MKNQTLRQACEQNGLEIIGENAFGQWKGYAVCVRPNSPYCNIDVATRANQKDKALIKSIRKDVKTQCPKGITGASNNGAQITFAAVLNKKSDQGEQLRALLDAIVAALKGHGVAPADTCALCGRETPDSLCLVNSYQPVHAACVRNYTDSATAAAEKNEEKGSYVLGILGAIIGMLVGLIPNVLTILFAERIYAVLFALVPLASMWAYRKLGGKKNVAAIVIVVLLSVLGVFVLESVINAIYIVQEYDIAFGDAFGLVLDYLFTGEGFGAFLSDGVTMFLFMALGIFFSWRYLFQTNQTQTAAVQAVGSTLRPLISADIPVEDSAEI